MPHRQPIPVRAMRTGPGASDYQSLLQWPFALHPFYEAQVLRLLAQDIPQRVAYGQCIVWVYRDPANNVVGFGTLDICDEYSQFTANLEHLYIPVLAVNPTFQKLGHGTSIVQHLVSEATGISQVRADLSDLLFLDVYAANRGAISLYEKCGFTTLDSDLPRLDPDENNEPFVIMAKRLQVAI